MGNGEYIGIRGIQGIQGVRGERGYDGKSAFIAARDGGYKGTEIEFNRALCEMANYILNQENKGEKLWHTI